MTVTEDRLRAFVERIERLNEEKDALGADIRELKSQGKRNDEIADMLNLAGKTTFHGKPFYAQLVGKMIKRSSQESYK